MSGCAKCTPPAAADDYAKWCCSCGRAWIRAGDRWVVRLGAGGPCAEPGCAFVGMRLSCRDCQSFDDPLRGDGCCRCEAHHVEHRLKVHGEAPRALVCVCGKPLGAVAPFRTPAGAPRCAEHVALGVHGGRS